MPSAPHPVEAKYPFRGKHSFNPPAGNGSTQRNRTQRLTAVAIGTVLMWAAFGLKKTLGDAEVLSMASPFTLSLLAEIAYIAGLTGVFGICWHSRQGAYRLRHVVIGALCLVAISLGLGGIGLSGIPDGGSFNTRAEILAHAAHFLPPLMLLTLTLTPYRWEVSKALYFALLSSVIAALLIIAELFITHDYFAAISEPTLQFVDSPVAKYILMGSYAAAMLTVAARSPSEQTVGTLLFAGAVVGGVGVACFISWPEPTSAFHLIGKAGDILVVAAIFNISFAEAIANPYREMTRDRGTAQSRYTLLDTIIQSIEDGVIAVDERLEIVASNAAACHLVGSKQVTGIAIAEVMSKLPTPDISLAEEVRLTLQDGRLRTGNCFLPLLPSRGNRCHLYYSTTRIQSIQHPPLAVLVLRDDTERRQLHERVSEGAKKAWDLIETNPDPLFVADTRRRITDVNASAITAMGIPRRDILGNDLASCFTDTECAAGLFDLSASGEPVRNSPLALRRADGGSTQVATNFVRQFDGAGNLQGILVIAHDVSDLFQAQIQLRFQAECDALTALPNRREFRDRVIRAIARCDEVGGHVAIILIDLDNFRDMNDTLGHGKGDEIIKCIADRLRESLRDADTVARIGGDEFAILLEDIEAPERTSGIVEKIRQVIADPLLIDATKDIRIACSAGVSIYPQTHGDADIQISNADTALFQAKESGKGRSAYFSADMKAALDRKVDIGHHLSKALARHELTLHYQPKQALANGKIVGVEALLRWKSEALGQVSPAEFIPVAESTGLILPIGQWVLDEACRQAAQWQAEFGLDIAVAVNLSARQFRDIDVAQVVRSTLDANALPPGRLEIEITESMVMADIEKAANVLEQLKALGVRVAIDDFGTGYSSLGYLRQLPLDHLKIDRSFVVDLDGNGNDAIVRSIVGLAHHLGLTVIAEGVETREQLNHLRQIGCDVVQGYYISRPCHPHELRRFLLDATEGSTDRAPTKTVQSCLSTMY